VSLVSCGNQHTLVMLQDGSLYAFGGNSEGALGMFSRRSSATWNVRLTVLADIGLGDNDDRDAPTLVELPDGVRAKRIFAGKSNTTL